jgi:hypothetical protein
MMSYRMDEIEHLTEKPLSDQFSDLDVRAWKRTELFPVR